MVPHTKPSDLKKLQKVTWEKLEHTMNPTSDKFNENNRDTSADPLKAQV